MNLEPHGKPIQAKLIFNPGAGSAEDSPAQLMNVIKEMQGWGLVPEIFLIGPGCDVPGMIQDALTRGILMFVVCGGDGTISSVARTLAGTPATLGIVPIGTQNNTALSLGIPSEIPAAVAILRNGQRIKVDVGMATGDNFHTPFLEVCSVGLVSAIFPSADDIQHGNLARIGDFLTSLVASPPAEIHLSLDGQQEIHDQGHIVLVSNMPYIGLHYHLGPSAAYNDGLLDVMFFADLNKLDLLGYILQGVGDGKPEDPRIQHYHVRRVDIDTQPDMPLMADGNALGEGRVSIEVWPQALAVMVGMPVPEAQAEPAEMVKLIDDAAFA